MNGSRTLASAGPMTVGRYLLLRLKEIGVDHVFGVAGDFVLGFLNQVLKSDVTLVTTCNELNAAYAADGYARIHGVGVFTSTYTVGELSGINGVAGSFAERIPVVVVTGSPSTESFRTRPLLHHTLGDYTIPRQMYEKITVAWTHLVSGDSAPANIDRVLTACLAERRPVYISLPSDVVAMPCAPPSSPLLSPVRPPSDPRALESAVDAASRLLDVSKTPVVIGGVDLIRFGLQDGFADLLYASGYPYVTMMLAKTLLSEQHPQFIGLYAGDRSRTSVQRRVEDADCILALGVQMTDFNTGGFTTTLAESKTIRGSLHEVSVGDQVFTDVHLNDFITSLTLHLHQFEPARLEIVAARSSCTHRRSEPFVPEAESALTVSRLFDRLCHYFADDSIILADTGVSLFSAAETLMPEGATFIGQTFYGSIGYAVGAALGASIAAPGRRVVLLVGDGAFQMTCQELSTMIRYRSNVVVVLLNNDGYTIERVITDNAYNDLQPWQYHRLVDAFGGGQAFDVRTEGELEVALTRSESSTGVVVIEVHTDRLDCPDALRSAGRAMAESNGLDT